MKSVRYFIHKDKTGKLFNGLKVYDKSFNVGSSGSDVTIEICITL